MQLSLVAYVGAATFMLLIIDNACPFSAQHVRLLDRSTFMSHFNLAFSLFFFITVSYRPVFVALVRSIYPFYQSLSNSANKK